MKVDFGPFFFDQGVFLCTLGFWAPKPWNIVLNKGIWDPKPQDTNMKGTNLKSLICGFRVQGLRLFALAGEAQMPELRGGSLKKIGGRQYRPQNTILAS